MFFKSLTATTLALAATSALAASDVATEIATALTQFQAQDLIPSPIPADSYDLTSGLVLSFGGSNASAGKSFTLPADDATLKQTPVYQLDVPSSMAANYTSMKFTIALVDPGALGSTLGGTNVTRHYLANDLTYADGKLTNSSAAIQDYTEPGPAAGSGAHRYLALVFDQGDDFKAPEGLDSPGTALSNMTLADYIDESKIGKIVAMSYILVEDVSAAWGLGSPLLECMLTSDLLMTHFRTPSPWPHADLQGHIHHLGRRRPLRHRRRLRLADQQRPRFGLGRHQRHLRQGHHLEQLLRLERLELWLGQPRCGRRATGGRRVRRCLRGGCGCLGALSRRGGVVGKGSATCCARAQGMFYAPFPGPICHFPSSHVSIHFHFSPLKFKQFIAHALHCHSHSIPSHPRPSSLLILKLTNQRPYSMAHLHAEPVALAQHQARAARPPHARRRARENHRAGWQGRALAQEGDEPGNAEDELREGAVLHGLVVQCAGHPHVLERLEVHCVLVHERRAQRTSPVEALGVAPLRLRELRDARGDVVRCCEAQEVVEGRGLRDVLGGLGEDDGLGESGCGCGWGVVLVV